MKRSNDHVAESRAATATGLRFWARGALADEAAVELLLRAFDGRFAVGAMPWVCVSDELTWLDPARMRANIGPLSGGERRVLSLVAALVDGGGVDVADVVAGVDYDTLRLVLAALSHAGGAHQSCELRTNAGHLELRAREPIVPWPA